MENQTCCFTGHRDIPLKWHAPIAKHLEVEMVHFIRQGVRDFCAGGACGFDLMASLAVLRLRHQFPDIRLILVLPCVGQDKYWNYYNKSMYSYIREQADKVTYLSEHYYNGCMQARNRNLVDRSQCCICYLNQETGGTAYTVNYAVQKGLKIVNLADFREK